MPRKFTLRLVNNRVLSPLTRRLCSVDDGFHWYDYAPSPLFASNGCRLSHPIGTTPPLNKRWLHCSGCEVPCWVYWNKHEERGTLFSELYFTRLKVNIRQISSSTEAEVDIILPSVANDLTSLIMREGTFLRILWNTHIHHFHFIEPFMKTLFIVSDISIVDDGSLETSHLPWFHTDSVQLPGKTVAPPSLHRSKEHLLGSDAHIGVRVRPATLAKCPRCWTYTRPHRDVLCARCSDVLSTSS